MFIGNLELAAKEEDLRVFFEELVKAERGVVTEGIEEGKEGGAVLEAERWVGGVRIIRDAATGLGKGFAYVSFRVSVLMFSFSIVFFNELKGVLVWILHFFTLKGSTFCRCRAFTRQEEPAVQ